MRFPTSETYDTLDVAALPPTEGNELNYRTRPDIEDELQFASRVLVSALGFAALVAIIVRFAAPEYLGYAVIAFSAAVWWFVPEATEPEADRPRAPSRFRIWLLAICGVCFALQAVLTAPVAVYFIAFPCAVAALVGLTFVGARQVIAWMAANPRVHGPVGREWQGYFPHVGHWVAHEPLPATRAMVLAPYFLFAAWVFGGLVFYRIGSIDGNNAYAPLLSAAGFVLFLVLIVFSRRLFAQDEGFSLRLTSGVL